MAEGNKAVPAGSGKREVGDVFVGRHEGCHRAVGFRLRGRHGPNRPYGALVEALRVHARKTSAPALRADLGAEASDIAAIIPEVGARLGDLTPSPSLPSGERQARLFVSLIEPDS